METTKPSDNIQRATAKKLNKVKNVSTPIKHQVKQVGRRGSSQRVNKVKRKTSVSQFRILLVAFLAFEYGSRKRPARTR